MPLLPGSHQDIPYELLNKPANSSNNTILGKLNQRRGLVAFFLLGFIGTCVLLRSSDSTVEARESSTKSNNLWSSWSTVGNKEELLSDGHIKVEAASFDQQGASCPTSPVVAATPYTSNKSMAQEYKIPEDDWHMPADVKLQGSDPLFTSRRLPFFRQEKDNIHREKGFGTEVRLSDAPFVRRSLYRHLLQSLNTFADHHDFHFWLAHGTLLGQKWGQKIMSGDTDVDVQCSLGDLHRVKKYEKQLWEDRFELIVNPHYLIRKTRNYRGLGSDRNVIDARWIDVLTGFYIDVTALSALQADRPLFDVGPFEEGKTAYRVQDKSPHRYGVNAISPSKRCQFEGMDMWCPNMIEEVLHEEYKDYDRPHFHTWRFNQTIQAFSEVSCPKLMDMYREPTAENCDQECRTVVSHERLLHWSALVMTGDVRRLGCLLKVTWNEDDKEVSREYWGREDPEAKIAFHNPNTTYPPVVI